jgi:hypothetical protein
MQLGDHRASPLTAAAEPFPLTTTPTMEAAAKRARSDKPLKGRSQTLTGPIDEEDGKEHADRSAARAMLRAVGWKKGDFRKPIIVVAVTHTNATPCNDHHREMGDIVAARIEELGGKPFIFGTPVVSDGEVRTPAAPCASCAQVCQHPLTPAGWLWYNVRTDHRDVRHELLARI